MAKRVRFPRGVKDWRKPPDTVIVTRPFRWGNPFVVSEGLAPGTKIHGRHVTYTAVATAADAVKHFREYMETPERRAEAKRHLRGKNLACSCELDQLCHADILLAIANSDPEG